MVQEMIGDVRVGLVGTEERLADVWRFAEGVLGLPVGVHTFDRYLESLRSTPQLLAHAWSDGGVCGCVLASIDGDHVLVGPVAVAESARRRGIGRAMLALIDRGARELGQTTLILGAREGAEPFYLACGYQPHLFLQVPRVGVLAELRELNPGHEVAWTYEGEGTSRLMLALDELDDPLQQCYQAAFPDGHAGYVFIRRLE